MMRLPAINAPASRLWIALSLALVAALALAIAGRAQVQGDRGIIPVASSTDIEVSGIEVDVSGEDSEDARQKGWQEAQRLAWEQLDGPDLPDSRIQSLVSAVVIERESLGPNRYIATLGVIFDRQRAGGLLGGQNGERRRSAPMLVLPVEYTAGTYTMYETRTEWQRAWAEHNAGRSAIDYVRPSGAGAESLLLNYGQTGRRSRLWWRTILDQFGAADVIVPIAELDYAYPGGPVTGRFIARHGPDNTFLDSFTLRVGNPSQVPEMYEAALTRFDAIFTQALRDGKLRPDPTLATDRVTLAPEWEALLRQLREANAAAEAPAPTRDRPAQTTDDSPEPAPTPTSSQAPAQTITFVVQFPTPDGAALDQALASVRGAPGVRGAAVSSTALGGMSVMRVTYEGQQNGLAQALRARGWNVTQGGTTLTISR